MAGRWIGNEIERTIYVIAGLPLAIRASSGQGTATAQEIRRAFAHAYWHPNNITEVLELALGLLVTPLAVPLAALWFTARNGGTIRRREGKGIAVQFWEQLRLYGSAGIFGPWYYILSLHREGMLRAPTFLQRCETKRGVYALLKNKAASPLGDKRRFAERCEAAGVRCVQCESAAPGALPDCDLFVKPLTGNGGKGAERWDRVGPRLWSDGTRTLGECALEEHLRSARTRLIIQKRVRPHPTLATLTSGALPTVRALTCLDENGRPELMAAVFRMAIAGNPTVDNIHAGGLACAVSLDAGTLGLASDLGSDARLGWCRDHPTTGARIEGAHLPFWREVRELAVRAHDAFSDRVLIGWDIAIAENGPIVIEGNRGPDVDLMQRFMETGFRGGHRLTDLLAHHLRVRSVLQRSGRMPSDNRARRACQ